MSNAEADLKLFLITVEDRNYCTFMNPDVCHHETRLGDFRMPHDVLNVRIITYNCRTFNASKHKVTHRANSKLSLCVAT